MATHGGDIVAESVVTDAFGVTTEQVLLTPIGTSVTSFNVRACDVAIDIFMSVSDAIPTGGGGAGGSYVWGG